jgi:hypothetical protein
MSADPKPLQEPDPLDVAADQVIAACDHDVRAAVRALIVAKGLLEVELNDVYAATARGFARERYYGRRDVLRRTSLCEG